MFCKEIISSGKACVVGILFLFFVVLFLNKNKLLTSASSISCQSSCKPSKCQEERNGLGISCAWLKQKIPTSTMIFFFLSDQLDEHLQNMRNCAEP